MSRTTIRLSADDVAGFAGASGDLNPLHVDEEFARRTPYGGTIAHGALVVIAALAAVPADRLAVAGGLKARFIRPVRIGMDYRFEVRHETDGAVAVVVREGHVTVLTVDLSPGRSFEDGVLPADGSLSPIAEAPGPSVVSAGERCSGDYAVVALSRLRAIAGSFGAGTVPDALLGALAWSSWFVGMRRPGRDALFAQVNIDVDPTIGGHAGTPRFETVLTTAESRTGTLVTDAVCTGRGSGLRIEMRAFHRRAVPAPTARSMTSLLAASDRLNGKQVLVVGGSRGIGAALTSVLAAQGATVWAAHRPSGSVVPLQREFGSDRIRSLVMDAGDGTSVRTALGNLAVGVTLDGIVLSAGPAVFSSSVHPDSVDSARAFVDESLALALHPLAAALPRIRRAGWLVAVSSSTVEDMPDEWPHYTIAKSAVEALARHCARRHGLRALVARAPRMWTDMSNGPLGRFGAVPTENVASAIVDWVLADGPAGSASVLGSRELAAWSPASAGRASDSSSESGG